MLAGTILQRITFVKRFKPAVSAAIFISMTRALLSGILALPALLACVRASAEATAPAVHLDFSRDQSHLRLESRQHKPLPEQYIWAKSATDPALPVYFRSHFAVRHLPSSAMLYVAGGQRISAWLNGQLVGEYVLGKDERTIPALYSAELSRLLKPGDNVLALAIVCLDKTLHADSADSSLLVKIVSPKTRPLLISDQSWKASPGAAPGWQETEFHDAEWPGVDLEGPVESNIDFFQVNNDSALYQWPGYDGISPFLSHMALAPAGIVSDDGQLQPLAPKQPIVFRAGQNSSRSLLLDFGREVTGRLQLSSASSRPFNLTYQYGESKDEAVKSPYLGVEPLRVSPGATVYGSKSAFRYVKLVVPFSENDVRIANLKVDGIYYPVRYRGSFESSDTQLNRLWEVGAYTVHLCMQDGVWDAPKRDRSRWMGDLDVSGEVINRVFADHFLIEDTMNRLNPRSLSEHVNRIPGYSAFWVMGEADYYRTSASGRNLDSILPNLRRLLAYMETDLDDRKLFANRHHASVFVDWSPDLDGKDTPEAYRATHFEYYKAFLDGAYLLREAGDTAAAIHCETIASQMREAAETYLKDAQGTFGPRVQSNVMAIYSGLANQEEQRRIAIKILRPLEEGILPDQDLSPYYSNYVIYAMTKAGDTAGAIGYIHYYWGSMLDQGATSLWEGYDPRWEKTDFHAHLRADDETGYETSLAHGWSAGPTAWLMEVVLGVSPDAPGYSIASIKPNLAGLEYAKGTLPTPYGLLSVDFRRQGKEFIASIHVPKHSKARVSLPRLEGQHLEVDGKGAVAALADQDSRLEAEIGSGDHRFIVR